MEEKKRIEYGCTIVIKPDDMTFYLKCNKVTFGSNNKIEWTAFIESATIFENKKHAIFASTDVENSGVFDYKILKVRRTIEVLDD